MPYVTQEQMVERFGAEELAHLTDRANDQDGEIDSAVLASAIADAEAEINAYIGVRYALPLPSVPADVTRIACDITRYRLYDEGTPDTVRRRYEDAVRLLKELAAGRAILTGSDGAPAPKADDPLSEYRSGAKTVAFGADFSRRYGAQP